jgi:hypothetical protein
MTDPGTEIADFDVDAYGFFGAAFGKRVCASLTGCREKMAAERLRVWQRIQAGAARGEPDMVYLAGEFSGPEQLLGGPDGSEEGSG